MNKLFGKRFEPSKEDALPPPQGGAGLYFYLLGTHFWKFVALNLLFVLFSIPVVTMPAALCGMNRVCIRLIVDGNCFLWYDFTKEFRESFRKGLLIGLISLAVLAAGYYLVSLGISNGQSIYGIIFLAVGIFMLIGGALLGSWTFVMIAMLPLNIRNLLKNARAMVGLEGKRDLAILAVQTACAALTLLLFPFSLIPVSLFLLSLVQYTICFIVNSAVQARIIAPFEAARQTKEAHL